MNAMIKSQVVRWHWWIAIEGARLCRSESGQEYSAGSKRRGRIFFTHGMAQGHKAESNDANEPQIL
ncbi:hypothetical protein B0H17DRAFT_1075978 [Mycena rosella]|uniref:Uncharacterized protein n=1 Tax=Mycena rosella TaxID=1033263 RepID=A0AAD7D830_MYCRO|nr:hypothetical protein B0H17DRAFT_1075978 [Mycena rosella]